MPDETPGSCPQALVHRDVADHAGLQSLAQHFRADVECPTQLLALLGGADQSPVAYSVGRRSLVQHLRADPESPMQLLALLAGTDHSVVADDIGLHCLARHLRQTSNAQRNSWPLPLALIEALYSSRAFAPAFYMMTPGTRSGCRLSSTRCCADSDACPVKHALMDVLYKRALAIRSR